MGHNPPRFAWSMRATRPFGLEVVWVLTVNRRAVGDVRLTEAGGLAYVGRVQGRPLAGRYGTLEQACSVVEDAYRNVRWSG